MLEYHGKKDVFIKYKVADEKYGFVRFSLIAVVEELEDGHTLVILENGKEFYSLSPVKDWSETIDYLIDRGVE